MTWRESRAKPFLFGSIRRTVQHIVQGAPVGQIGYLSRMRRIIGEDLFYSYFAIIKLCRSAALINNNNNIMI